MSNCCAPKTPFVPEQILKAVDEIEKLCEKRAKQQSGGADGPSLQSDTAFGIAIEMSADGNLLVIGAAFYDAKDVVGIEQSDSGAVFVFRRKESFAACDRTRKDDKRYKLQQILIATDPKTGANRVQQNALFGTSLSVSADGSRIVVGAFAQSVDEGAFFGAVYVFDQKPKSLLYQPVQSILASALLPTGFGFEVALSGDGRVLFVSGISNEAEITNSTVSVYEDCTFDFSTECLHSKCNKSFRLKQTFGVADIVQGTSIFTESVFALGFRLQLDESGNTGLISAPLSSVVNESGVPVPQAGLVFVVERSVDRKCATGLTKWQTTQVLTSKTPKESTAFGLSIAMPPDARFVAIEEPGRDDAPSLDDVGLVSVFERSCKRQPYKLVAELSPDADDIKEIVTFSVKSVSISDDGCTIAVGYELSTVSGVNAAGVVITYQRHCGSSEWKQTQILTAFPSVTEEETFGNGLAMSADANTLVVGAFEENVNDFVYAFSARFARHC